MNNQESQGTTNQPEKGLGEMRCSTATLLQCPTCGASGMQAVEQDKMFRGVKIENACWQQCNACGECVYAGPEIRKWERIVAESQ